MVTPPIFCAGYRANRSATTSTHLPPKYPSCRGVTQDFAKSFRGQHGQPKYLSKRTVNIGKPTKELNGMSPTMLGMRHSSCRRPKRFANRPEAHQCPLLSLSGHSSNTTYYPLSEAKRTLQLRCEMSANDPKRTSSQPLTLVSRVKGLTSRFWYLCTATSEFTRR